MKYKIILLLILVILAVGCTKKADMNVYKPSEIVGNKELIGKNVIVEGIIAPNTIVCMASGVCSYQIVVVDDVETADEVKEYLSDYASVGIRIKKSVEENYLGCEEEGADIVCDSFDAGKTYKITGKLSVEKDGLYGYSTNSDGDIVGVGGEADIYYVVSDQYTIVE